MTPARVALCDLHAADLGRQVVRWLRRDLDPAEIGAMAAGYTTALLERPSGCTGGHCHR